MEPGSTSPRRLRLPDFKAIRDRRPSIQLSACGSELVKGICTSKPKVPDDKLMFTKSDINKTKNPLAKLFRLIMYKLRITPDDYRASAIAYGRSLGKTGAEMTTPLSNARKAIFAENLSTMQLERNLLYANWDIIDIGLTIQNHETGEILEFKLSDIPKLKYDQGTEISEVFSPEPTTDEEEET